MNDETKDLLMEQAASAFRERNVWGRILPSPAWWDLSPEDREMASQRQLESRIGRALLAGEAARAIVDFCRLDIHFNLPPKHANIALLARCYVLIPV